MCGLLLERSDWSFGEIRLSDHSVEFALFRGLWLINLILNVSQRFDPFLAIDSSGLDLWLGLEGCIDIPHFLILFTTVGLILGSHNVQFNN